MIEGPGLVVLKLKLSQPFKKQEFVIGAGVPSELPVPDSFSASPTAIH